MLEYVGIFWNSWNILEYFGIFSILDCLRLTRGSTPVPPPTSTAPPAGQSD